MTQNKINLKNKKWKKMRMQTLMKQKKKIIKR